MAIAITKVYKEHFSAARFVGKCYTNDDRKNGSFGFYWDEWNKSGRWGELDKIQKAGNDDDYFGLMTCDEQGNGFQYWIGRMFPPGASVPEGFSGVDLPEGDVGICWIYGSAENGELFGEGPHKLCLEKLKEKGLNNGGTKQMWFFERYNNGRFMKKDEKGNVILDYGVYL